MTLFDQQIAEIKISYSHLVKPKDQMRITGSSDVYKYISPIWPDIDYRESFAVLLLSRGNRVLGINWISKGGVSGTVVDPKLVFQSALMAHASSLILVHNHPSCTLIASDADKNITNKIKSAGGFLDICVLDHIILCSTGYLSMADEGLV